MSKYRELGTFFHYKHQAENALQGNCPACYGSGQVHDHSGPNGDSVGMMQCWKCGGSGKDAAPEEVAKAKETMKMLEEGLCLYCQFPMSEHRKGASGCSQQDCFWVMVKYLHNAEEKR